MPTDEVGQLQGPHGLVGAQLHASVNVLSAAHALHEAAAEMSCKQNLTAPNPSVGPHKQATMATMALGKILAPSQRAGSAEGCYGVQCIKSSPWDGLMEREPLKRPPTSIRV